MKRFLPSFLCAFIFGCAPEQLQVTSQPTRVEPLPIKVGGLKDSSVEIAVPLKIEEKKHGGYRSPIEIRVKMLLTRPDYVPIPITPTGATVGLRIRW